MLHLNHLGCMNSYINARGHMPCQYVSDNSNHVDIMMNSDAGIQSQQHNNLFFNAQQQGFQGS